MLHTKTTLQPKEQSNFLSYCPRSHGLVARQKVFFLGYSWWLRKAENVPIKSFRCQRCTSRNKLPFAVLLETISTVWGKSCFFIVRVSLLDNLVAKAFTDCCFFSRINTTTRRPRPRPTGTSRLLPASRFWSATWSCYASQELRTGQSDVTDIFDTYLLISFLALISAFARWRGWDYVSLHFFPTPLYCGAGIQTQ